MRSTCLLRRMHTFRFCNYSPSGRIRIGACIISNDIILCLIFVSTTFVLVFWTFFYEMKQKGPHFLIILDLFVRIVAIRTNFYSFFEILLFFLDFFTCFKQNKSNIYYTCNISTQPARIAQEYFSLSRLS